MSNHPTGLYDQFSPPERLTLVMEALARGDEGEVARLASSCPRRTYTAPDAEFADRVRVSFDTVAVACIDLRSLFCRLHALHWGVFACRQMATLHQINADMAFLDGLACGQRRPQIEFYVPVEQRNAGPGDGGEDADDDPPDCPDRMAAVSDRGQRATDCVANALGRTAYAVAVEFVTCWAAFGRFCRSHLGVGPAAALAAWGLVVAGEFEATAEQYAHVKPDAAEVDDYYRHLCKHWDGRFGEGGDFNG